nr:flagella assembly protein FlgT middle domain-containing protein [uncultured Undibacterium sp.]
MSQYRGSLNWSDTTFFQMLENVRWLARRVFVLFALGATLLTLSSCGLFSKPPTPMPVAERVLKKKVVMTGFAVNVAAQVQDLDDIAQGFPREMLNRLERSGSYIVRQSPNLLSFDLKQTAPTAKMVQQVAAENDAQFVISGEIRNAGIRTDKKFLGLWESRSRHIEVEFSIYDGLSGAFLSRHLLYRPAEDDSKVGRDKPFGSVAFYATSFGKAVDSLIGESVTWIRKDLAPFPLMAKIIKIKDKEIIFDAGLSSNLIVGDQALVVSDYDQLPTLGLSAQQARPLQYGIPQASMGKMKVIQVQLPFAVGELLDDQSNKAVQVKVGDFVRFDTVAY